MKYVAGFLFNKEETKVALIEKIKPSWQKGKLNAIGGKIEKEETPLEAMIREFKEETGLHIPKWRHTITLKGKDWTVWFFKSYGDPSKCKSMEKEKVKILHPLQINNNTTIPNLKWILPITLDQELNFPIIVHYK